MESQLIKVHNAKLIIKSLFIYLIHEIKESLINKVMWTKFLRSQGNLILESSQGKFIIKGNCLYFFLMKLRKGAYSQARVDLTPTIQTGGCVGYNVADASIVIGLFQLKKRNRNSQLGV